MAREWIIRHTDRQTIAARNAGAHTVIVERHPGGTYVAHITPTPYGPAADGGVVTATGWRFHWMDAAMAWADAVLAGLEGGR